MKKLFFALLSIIIVFPSLLLAQKNLPTAEEKTTMAASQVLMRVIGIKSNNFTFETITSDKGLDEFEVIALDGKVLVKGTSTLAMTRGAYEYLRTACNVQYTWSTDKITPPAKFPNLTIPRTVSPYKLREYYNVCAYGYSTVYWKWEDWQRELDWMALHGINMPVAMAGQEAIWQKVYKSMGMTDAELRNYFTGPAFLPWQRMGNVNKHNGPLPQTYIDESAKLQKLIIERMNQLGMQPIVPTFSGFVPEAYKRLHPETKLLTVKGWANFSDTCQSYMLTPGSPDFNNIGKKFIEEYQNAYGKVHYYLADLFNENEVPVSKENRYEELAGFGKSVYDAINSADPQGTWVMQGWLFFNDSKFWDKESVKAFLSNVPDDRMLIIDLANESFHGWEKLDGFNGKPWIYSIIHNYGGNSQMIGNLPLYATDAAAMLSNPKKGKITGFGISPEGIQNNEVVYELLTDVSWSSKPIDIKLWLKNYAKQRYGIENENLFLAWTSLLESVYSVPTAFIRNAYQQRPSANPETNMIDQPAFDQAVASFLNNAEPFMGNLRFKHDLVQLVVQYAGYKVDMLINRAIQLHEQGNNTESQVIFEKVKELMIMMDGMTYSLPDQRLETWIDHARKWGKTKEESDYFEADAKRQVTVWGNSGTWLSEYACKVWSGLLRDYYLPRWMKYASSLNKENDPDLNQWEEAWITTPGLRTLAPITGDLLTYAKKLYSIAGQYAVEYVQVVSIEAKGKENKAEINLTPLISDPSSIYAPVRTEPVQPRQTGSGNSKTKPANAKQITDDNSKGLKIYYTTDGTSPMTTSLLYSKPFDVELPLTIKAAAFYDNKSFGGASIIRLPVSFGKTVDVSPVPSIKYPEHNECLTDGLFGTTDFHAGHWLSFEGENMNATIDLMSSLKVKKVTINYLENASSCIYGPTAVVILTSTDGKSFTQAYSYDLPNQYNTSATLKNFTAPIPITDARFIRVTLYNMGTCPEKSNCAGRKAWLFVDEITVE
ncbi:MAG: alpha-N-acetylglucosaminidase C-terminal domain-containing protein [Bacteroidetes bacterium]|nr:alpha-N-acetylglucosaminidase C-terminal domain-containing protein [Bacteroidota bacterium]